MPLQLIDLTPSNESVAERNDVLVSMLREDAHSEALLDATRKDVELGRMSKPVRYEDISSADVLLHPRFAVEKVKPSGEVGVRPIDNFSWAVPPKRGTRAKRRRMQKAASVNGCFGTISRAKWGHSFRVHSGQH